MGKKKRKKMPDKAAAAAPSIDLPAEAPALEPQAVPPLDPEPGPVAAGTDRRDFLTLSGNLLVGACLLGGVGLGVRAALPDFRQGPPARFVLGRVSDFKMNTLTWLRQRDLFVLHDATGFGAFSARCTHLGCTVQRVASGFVCPCHGARFDALGRVLGGPARRPLPWFRLWLEADGRLWVDTEDEQPAGCRSRRRLELAGQPAEQP